MGNTDSNPVRNLDKRTARREYANEFIGAISTYRYHHLNDNNNDNNDINNDINNDNNDNNDNNMNDVHVYVRKRPIFSHEKDNGEFDVITNKNKKCVVIHDCKMHSDMKRMFLNNHEFIFDEIFDDKCNNTTVYNNAIAPLVNDTINNGIFSTIMVYGQTGSGKTYTMSSVYEQCCRDIFDLLHEKTDRFNETSRVSVSFFEIVGDSCIDLFNSSVPTQLYTGSDGCVHASPAAEPIVNDADELMALINYACSIRSTAATGVHDSSSRSHAILRIYIQKNYISDEDVESEGVLTLVDLAGTEHKIDSLYHSADRRKETASINASLMALKDCLRSRSSGNNMSFNYRKSTLTKMLKASFFMKSAKTVVIATVSPASKDTEHSLNTLRHACLMDGQHEKLENEETRFITGGTVTTQQVGTIDLAGIGRKNFANRKAGIEKSLATSNGNETDLRTRDKSPLKEDEKGRIRRAAERKHLAAMPASHRQILLKARKMFNNIRQQMRMRKVIPEIIEAVPVTNEDEHIEVSDNNHIDSDRQSPLSQKDIKSKKYKEIKKLYAQVYSDTVPPALVRRQFITLMKMKGYSAEDITTYAPPSPTDVALDKVSMRREKDESESSSYHSNTKKDVVKRIHFADQPTTDSNKNTYTSTQSSSQSNVSAADIVAKEAQSRQDRQVSAREIRERLERERKENILKRINNDKAKTATVVSAVKKVVSNVDKIINDLEQQLLTPDITPAQVFAIKKNIAMHKAVKVKEQRQQEMETRQRKRDEEDQKKREKLALEAGECDNNDTTIPATNSGTNKNANIDFNNDGRQSNHYDNHQSKQGYYSSSSQHHQHHQHQQNDTSLPPRFLRSKSELSTHHQDVNYNDYQHQHQLSGQHHRLQQQQQQHIYSPDSFRSKTAPNFTRSDRSSYGGIGASSAPFGNAYNDDDDGTD